MATHSSILAWRIPGTEEPGGLPPMGSHRVGHNWSDLAVAVYILYMMIYNDYIYIHDNIYTVYFRYYIKICNVRIFRWKCHFILLWGKFSNLDNFTHVLYGWFKVKNSRGECTSRKLLWTPASIWHGKSFYLELNLLIQTTDEATTGLPFIVWDLQVCISARVLQQRGSLLLSLWVFVWLFLLLQALWVPRQHRSTLQNLPVVMLKWWGWMIYVISQHL